MITGSDNQKASVGFKAFGLRTEGSCMDLLDCCVLQRGRGKLRLCVCVCICVRAYVHVRVCVWVCVDVPRSP